MFTTNDRTLVAPVTTSIFNAPAPNANITAYLSDFRATDNNTVATLGGILLALTTAANSNDDTPLRDNVRKMFTGNSYIAIHNLMADPGADPADDNGRNIVSIRFNLAASVNWIINLVNAAKKKPLTDDNVEGFFAMMGHTSTKAGVITRFINQIQAFFPDNIDNEPFRNMLAPGVWTTYRTSRVSTGAILINLLPDFRILRITVQGDADEDAITACAARPWDTNLSLAIRDKFKAYGCLYLQAAGTSIDNWYQGNRAVSNLPAAKVRMAKEIFRRYLEVKNSVGDLNTFVEAAGFANSDAIRDFFA